MTILFTVSITALVTASTAFVNVTTKKRLDGKYDDIDDDYASTPHPSAHYESSE